MTDVAIYGALFLNAFVAATLLPAYSEVTFAALLVAGESNAWLLFFAATSGNVAGSVVNWWLGRGIARFRDKRWFPFTPNQFERASNFFRRYGRWSLLLAWVPIIGDPLTLVAGTLRVSFSWFITLVTIGKAVRYAVVAFTVLGLSGG